VRDSEHTNTGGIEVVDGAEVIAADVETFDRQNGPDAVGRRALGGDPGGEFLHVRDQPQPAARFLHRACDDIGLMDRALHG
jgi:hypothetical protein